MTRVKTKLKNLKTIILDYDYKKIVEEFEKWLTENIIYLDDEADIKENKDVRVAEAYRIQTKFNSIQRKYMILK